MDDQRESQRRLILRMTEASGLDLSTLARRAGLSPSTLTRFMNTPVKHLLSTRTLARLTEASGYSGEKSADLSKADRIKAVIAVANVLGVAPAEVGATDPTSAKWLDVISRLPASAQDHAFELLRGLAEAGGSANHQIGPSKTDGARRQG